MKRILNISIFLFENKNTKYDVDKQKRIREKSFNNYSLLENPLTIT